MNEANKEASDATTNPPTQSHRAIYPEMNSRMTGLLKWFALGFIVVVILIQQYSGYN